LEEDKYPVGDDKTPGRAEGSTNYFGHEFQAVVTEEPQEMEHEEQREVRDRAVGREQDGSEEALTILLWLLPPTPSLTPFPAGTHDPSTFRDALPTRATKS